MEELKAEILEELREEIKNHVSQEKRSDSQAHRSFVHTSNPDKSLWNIARQNFGFCEEGADNASSSEDPKLQNHGGTFMFPY